MRHDYGLPGGRLPRRNQRRSSLLPILCAGFGGLALLAFGLSLDTAKQASKPVAAVAPQTSIAKAQAEPQNARPETIARPGLGALIAPTGLGSAPGRFERAPVAQLAWDPATTGALPPDALAAGTSLALKDPPSPITAALPPSRETSARETSGPETSAAASAHPLPLARPSDLVLPAPAVSAPASPRLVSPATPRRTRTAAATPPVPSEDNRNFFQKLFNVGGQSGPTTALAYAAPQDEQIDRGRLFRLSPTAPPGPASAALTAVYDISAKTLYMPNGERLEAHSGFGEKMDDPGFVHVRMKGATPPHTYTLTEREALFHGSRAVRMHPVGGAGAIFGRTGLLVHPYLLGPRGDSNGCISVRDYDRFLQAFLRGEVKRIVVVAGGGSSRVAMADRARN